MYETESAADNLKVLSRQGLILDFQDRIMSIGLLPLCHTAGVLRARVLRGVLMLSASIVLAACQSRADTPPPGPHGGPPVSVAPAVQRQVQESDEFTGRLEAPQSVDVRPRVTGYIKKVHFHDGQEVKAGDLLFTIDPDPYLAELAKARAQLAAAQTQVELARSEEARAHKLIDVQHDFSVKEFIEIDAKELPWSKTAEEVNERWRKRIKYEFLMMKLEKTSDLAAKDRKKGGSVDKPSVDKPTVVDTPKEEEQAANSPEESRKRLHKRYRTIRDTLGKTEPDEVIEMFDRCLAEAYARAGQDLEDFRKAMANAANEKVHLFRALAYAVLDPAIDPIFASWRLLNQNNSLRYWGKGSFTSLT